MYMNNINKLATLIDGNVLYTTNAGKPFAKVFPSAQEAYDWAKNTKVEIKAPKKIKVDGKTETKLVTTKVGFDIFIVGTVEDAVQFKQVNGIKGFIKNIEEPKGAYKYVLTAINNARLNNVCKHCKGDGLDPVEDEQFACPQCLGIGFMFGQVHQPRAKKVTTAIVPYTPSLEEAMVTETLLTKLGKLLKSLFCRLQFARG